MKRMGQKTCYDRRRRMLFKIPPFGAGDGRKEAKPSGCGDSAIGANVTLHGVGGPMSTKEMWRVALTYWIVLVLEGRRWRMTSNQHHEHLGKEAGTYKFEHTLLILIGVHGKVIGRRSILLVIPVPSAHAAMDPDAAARMCAGLVDSRCKALGSEGTLRIEE